MLLWVLGILKIKALYYAFDNDNVMFSGSGKTTLLNAISYRNRRKLIVQGSVLLNGKETSSHEITKFSGYVHQHDAFIGTLTVREHLVFIVSYLKGLSENFIFNIFLHLKAMLKLGSSYTNEQKYKRVDETINEVNLKA